jgi:RNA polymerase sigma-70 factor (ECF subfamily)
MKKFFLLEQQYQFVFQHVLDKDNSVNAKKPKSDATSTPTSIKKCDDTMHKKKDQTEDNLSSFEESALPHMNLIYRLSYRLTGSQEDAQDLTQDTFRIGFEKFEDLREKRKCRNWLVVIMKNLYYKNLRKKIQFPTVDLEEISFHLADTKDFYHESIRNILSEELQEMLNKLDEKYKTPLVLSFMEDFSYKEIASILNIPIGTVMSRIARAKIFLRKEFLKKTAPHHG